MNKKTINLAKKYFQTQENYFWQWAEDGTVIEWTNGQTICYREELVGLLKALEPNGFPPLDSILLLVAACQNSWIDIAERRRMLEEVVLFLSIEQMEIEEEELRTYMKNGLKVLGMISSLPIMQKTAVNRAHLVKEFFASVKFKLPSSVSTDILTVFKSGQCDEAIFKSEKPTAAPEFKLAFGCLIDAWSPYKNAEEFLLQLKTGLKNVPDPQDFELPEQDDKTLIAQLAEEDKTHGLSKLTQRLMASLHIPMHTQGVSDQAYGGISDITNRGDFDRLLLSELAHDDLSLMARLVNNEALYYHHEAPPIQQHQHRMILLDSTIKMWGLPRVFGLSAALACTQNAKEGVSVAAYSLHGKTYQTMDLATKDGVVEAMSHLDGHLDCSQALFDFFEIQEKVEGLEKVLISTEDIFKHQSFQTNIALIQQQLDYLITVNRAGTLQFFQFKNGQRKLLNTLKVDLKEHLFSHRKIKKKPSINKKLPAFFHQETSFLYFPTPSTKLSKYNTVITPNDGVMMVTEDQRLLYWEKRNLGAMELMHYIEGGSYYFGVYEYKVYIIVHNQKKVIWYSVDLQTGETISKDYSERVKMTYRGIQFKKKYFYIGAYPKAYLIDCETEELLEQPHRELVKITGSMSTYSPRLDFGSVRKHINNSYSTLQKPKRMYIDTSGCLCIGGHFLNCVNNYAMQWLHKKQDFYSKHRFAKDQKPIQCVEKIEEKGLSGNESIKFCRSVFANGSEAMMDSRGLLHLRSANKNLPEVTLVLIIGQPTAAWASDGAYCGNSYFHNKSQIGRYCQVEDFYGQYVQAFIDELK